MSDDQALKYVLKPAAVGITAGAAIAAWRPNQMVLIGNQQYPLALVTAAGGFIASEVAELVNAYVNDHIPTIRALSHPVHAAVNVGVLTGGICAVDNYLSPGLISDQGLPEIVALAAIGEVAGTYLANEFLLPWYRTLKGSDSA